MEASELRIGNLVAYEPTIDDWEEIIVKCGNIIQCEISPDSFTPIPLTEEWLLKFGFELLCRESHSGYKETIFSMQKPSWTLMKLDKGWGAKFWQGNKLEYVHQLQNLYFALTNEELKLKEDERSTKSWEKV